MLLVFIPAYVSLFYIPVEAINKTAESFPQSRRNIFRSGGIEVQDIIKKIIEIDKTAQKMTNDALALKEQIKSSIEQDKKDLRDKYIQRARRRIEVTAQTEEKFLQDALDEIKARYDGISTKLKEQYELNHERWAEEIYKRVIGG